MNLKKLKSLEDKFLSRYPGGFEHPELAAIGKKHKVGNLVEFSQDAFSKKQFKQITQNKTVVDNMVKVVSRSSMISIFEKPKFKEFVLALSPEDQVLLTSGLNRLLHGKEQQGFEIVLDILGSGKLAKWSLITVFAAYFRPDFDVLVKPNTTKGILQALQLDELIYKPRPSWEFYTTYRDIINEMKTHVDPALSPNNAAFCGFLMMATHP